MNSTTTVDDSQLSFEEIDDRLKEPREKILQVYAAREANTFNTSELRQATGISSGSINHHLKTLVEWGLLTEEADREYAPQTGGSKARLWTVTERGEAFTADYVTYAPPKSLEELGERLVALEAEVDALRETHEEDIDDVHDQIQESFENLKENFRDMLSPGENGQRR